MRRLLVALLVLALAVPTGGAAGSASASPASALAATATGPAVVALFPDPVADGDSGEFVLLTRRRAPGSAATN